LYAGTLKTGFSTNNSIKSGVYPKNQGGIHRLGAVWIVFHHVAAASKVSGERVWQEDGYAEDGVSHCYDFYLPGRNRITCYLKLGYKAVDSFLFAPKLMVTKRLSDKLLLEDAV
jgi:hypothetical protein